MCPSEPSSPPAVIVKLSLRQGNRVLVVEIVSCPRSRHSRSAFCRPSMRFEIFSRLASSRPCVRPPTVDGSSIGVRRAVPLRPGERCHGVFSACGRSLPSRRHPRGQQDILCGHVPTHAGVVWNDASVVTASTTCMTKHRGVRGQALFLFHPAIAL